MISSNISSNIIYVRSLIIARSVLIVLVLLLLFSSTSQAYSHTYSSDSIALLTVSESADDTEVGGVANLDLVVKPGTGRIYIDSFPLSRIDTQITFRFATEIACNLLEKDCSGYDFFYTVTANTGLVGGPSAGAAATVLTVALLDGQELRDDTIMTGTINSGNLIGPVAGISAKIIAADEKGFARVLIPEWDLMDINISVNNVSTNVTTLNASDDIIISDSINNSIRNNDIIDNKDLDNTNNTYLNNTYINVPINTAKSITENNANDVSIDVVAISTLEEALYYFTGKNYSRAELEGPVYSKEYSDMMKGITLELCTKYGSVVDGRIVLPNLTAYDINSTNITQDNFFMALGALNNDSYYSAASLCFGGNVKIKNVLLSNLTDTELKILYAQTLTEADDFLDEFKKDFEVLSTISELETYMIVSERAYDSKELLSDMDPDNISRQQLAYAIERLETAKAWSKFSDFPGPKFMMDNDLMHVVCMNKLSEAEERLNYLELYYPQSDIRQEMSEAHEYYLDKDYPLCIFTASKIKADADIVLSAIFISEGELDKLFDEKISAAQRVMNRQKSEGIFPILGYSYYEYANTLKSTDEYSALLYAEYALELSNIDMYFKKYEPLSLSSGMASFVHDFHLYTFIFGILAGIILSVLILLLSKGFKVYKKKSRR